MNEAVALGGAAILFFVPPDMRHGEIAWIIGGALIVAAVIANAIRPDTPPGG